MARGRRAQGGILRTGKKSAAWPGAHGPGGSCKRLKAGNLLYNM